jgi:subtilisin family serine protease
MLHTLSKWLRGNGSSLSLGKCASRPKRANRRVSSFRPTLELFEQRQLLTTGLVNGLPFTEMSRDLIGLDAAQQHGFTGSGYSVAVIDTGIHFQHPALGGGWGNRVIDGHDFVGSDLQPDDANGHGTHVAGIIGSSDATWRGIVPNVNFIDLRVLNAAGQGNTDEMAAALQWVIDHRQQDNIVAVNMSIWDGQNYADPSSEPQPYRALDSKFQTLKNQGVFIAVCAGNGFTGTVGLSAPAISPYVVAVGAVTDRPGFVDQVAAFSQRSTALGLLAPGDPVVSTWNNNSFQPDSGTSMATPMVAGAAAMIHQALDAHGHPELTSEDAIVSLLRASGRPVSDPATGLTFRRLALDRAMEIADAPSFVTSPGGTTYCLTRGGELWSYSVATGWVDLDSNVQTIASSGGSYVFELKTSGALRAQYADGHAVLLDTGVQAIAGSGGNYVFDLKSGGALIAQYGDSASHGYLLDTGVISLVVARDGAVYDLTSSGTLKYRVGNGWNQLDTSVVAIWLGADGITLNAQEASGVVRQFVE